MPVPRCCAAGAMSLVILLACGEPTDPTAPASIAFGFDSVTLVAIGFSQHVAGRVLDGGGRPVPGLAITYSSRDPAVATVNTEGVVTAISNGRTVVTAAHGSLSSEIAIQVMQVATQLARQAGDIQTGEVGQPLGVAVEVELRDARGHVVPGGLPSAVVEFVAGQGGSVGSGSVAAAANGRASTTWTLGPGRGSQSLTVRVAGGAGTTEFMATAYGGPPDTLIKVSGDGQVGATSRELPDSIVVQALDRFGNPSPGAEITFTVTAGTSYPSPDVVETDTSGYAGTRWLLASAGPHTMAVSATGAGSPVTYHATAEPPFPFSLSIVQGDGQTGLVGLPLNLQPAIAVADQFGNGLANQPVSFSITEGGGSVSSPAATTDGAGVVRVTWTLGGTPGANQLTASSGSLSPVPVSATGEVAAFNLDLRFLNQPGTYATAFSAAEAKWENIIFGDLADMPVNVAAGWCGVNALPAVNETVDDLVVFVELTTIDGEGGILGGAGPCLTRGSAETALGYMVFDVADLAELNAADLLDEVVVHELGHVLGIGTLWGSLLVGAGTADPGYTGAQAFQAYHAIGGPGARVPVENTGGAGTRDAHWRESILGIELMTGFLNGGVANPLSRVSVGSLWDLGYDIVMVRSDPYGPLGPVLLAPGASRRIDLRNDIHPGPVFEIDPATGGPGRVIRP